MAAPDPAVAAPLFEAVGLAVERLQAGAVQGLYRRAGQQVRMADVGPDQAREIAGQYWVSAVRPLQGP